jgi:hypothetical protein
VSKFGSSISTRNATPAKLRWRLNMALATEWVDVMKIVQPTPDTIDRAKGTDL